MKTGYQYYNTCLSKRDQEVYSKIRHGLLSCQDAIHIHEQETTDIKKILEAILNDNPVFFFISNWSIARSGKETIIHPHYLYEGNLLTEYIKDVDKKAGDLALLFRSQRGDMGAIRNLHDYIVRNVAYGDNNGNSHNAMGPLLQKTGVCDGISMFAKLICDYMNIPCVVISGEASSRAGALRDKHAWNAIRYLGAWYMFDFTFDNTLSDIDNIRNDYFCITETEMAKDHFNASALFGCAHKKRDYYTTNGLIVTSRFDIEKLLRNNGTVGNFCFKVSDVWSDFCCEKDLPLVMTSLNIIKNKFKRYEYTFNSGQNVCYVSLF